MANWPDVAQSDVPSVIDPNGTSNTDFATEIGWLRDRIHGLESELGQYQVNAWTPAAATDGSWAQANTGWWIRHGALVSFSVRFQSITPGTGTAPSMTFPAPTTTASSSGGIGFTSANTTSTEIMPLLIQSNSIRVLFASTGTKFACTIAGTYRAV